MNVLFWTKFHWSGFLILTDRHICSVIMETTSQNVNEHVQMTNMSWAHHGPWWWSLLDCHILPSNTYIWAIDKTSCRSVITVVCVLIAVLWKLLGIIKRNSKVYQPSPTVNARLNLISILSLAKIKWEQNWSSFSPSASKSQNFNVKSFWYKVMHGIDNNSVS